MTNWKPLAFYSANEAALWLPIRVKPEPPPSALFQPKVIQIQVINTLKKVAVQQCQRGHQRGAATCLLMRLETSLIGESTNEPRVGI